LRGAKLARMSPVKSAQGENRAASRETSRPRRYTLAGQAIEAPQLPAGLYLVATPIGNLRDITLRALEILGAADRVACEDTRVTRKLFDHYGLSTPLIPYHEHNAEAARPQILQRIAAGEAIALVSDAGTPLISDPGYKLAREAAAAGHTVSAAPGASAALMALTVSGLPTDRFFFEGFLPPKSEKRRARIAALARIPSTLVLFESGARIAATLSELAEGFGAREAVVARELTKLHEEVRRGTLEALAADYAAGAETRGEIAIVVAPPIETKVEAGDVDALLRAALTRVSLKDAVAEVAAATGEARRTVYGRALEIAKEADGAPR
jgi:16S rRNA (cytidine1402-2'-O)-methyltransferase